MNIRILYVSLLTFFISCNHNAQIKIESPLVNIKYKTSYKLNEVLEEQLEDNSKPWMAQQVFFEYALKGDYKNAHRVNIQENEEQESYTKQQVDSIYAKYDVVNAVKYVINEARQHKITIINESHLNPRHRVFTKSLLKKLFDSGYTYLGLEALYNGAKGGTQLSNGAKILDEKDTLINDRKYPITASGVYTKEPQMGNLVREAIEIGYTIFSYEKTGVGSGYHREYGQAKNIQKVIQQNPNAKFLIHCGYSHGYEGYGLYETNGKAMAGWLKELTNIDPLTIDQTKYSEYGSSTNNHPLIYALDTEESSVLVNLNGSPMGYRFNNEYTDIAIIHPVNKYINNRPSWLFQNGVKHIVLDVSSLELDFPLMILVFKEGEDINRAIPIDLIDVKNHKENGNLALKPGKYTLVAINKNKEAFKLNVLVQ